MICHMEYSNLFMLKIRKHPPLFKSLFSIYIILYIKKGMTIYRFIFKKRNYYNLKK